MKYAISDGQTKTGNNDKYLRLLWEIDNNTVGKGKKWVFHAKGGAYRRWYGNIDTLIDWSVNVTIFQSKSTYRNSCLFKRRIFKLYQRFYCFTIANRLP